jgi:CDP-diacylglycerol--glycerol-3-phosphate 3-phosphatidyltransferase
LPPRLDLPALRRSVWRTTLAFVLVQMGLALLIAWRPGPLRLGLGFLAFALPWTLATGLLLSRQVHLLYSEAGLPLRGLNLATRVTLIRMVAVPLVVSLVLAGELLPATLAFLAAALSDAVDGSLARRRGEVTQLGRVADPSIDAVFCGFSLSALALADLLPAWVFALVVLRYALLAAGALWLHRYAGFLPARATVAGRFYYFIQYSLLVGLLLGAATGHTEAGRWIPRALGVLQVLVILQLLLLGRSLYQELLHVD